MKLKALSIHAGITLVLGSFWPGLGQEACLDQMRKISVTYSEAMVADNLHTVSPSSSKPKYLVDALLVQKFPITLVPVNPVMPADFFLAHDPRFVADILASRRNNGFGNKSEVIAQTLPYTTGSLYTAARLSLREEIACSPTSGFHHASYNQASGFCTFNGLIVTSMKLMKESEVERVAIIDADQHWGDGTDILLDHHALRDRIFHYSFGSEFPKSDNDGPAYLHRMERLQVPLSRFSPDLIIYQAGADPHVNDPFGGLLTTEQLFERDRRMFQIAKQLKIPIVWNLAGGYQRDRLGSIQPVIEIHLNTFRAALQVYQKK